MTSVEDAAGDNADGRDPRGDILGVGVTNSGSSVKIDVRTAAWDDPTTSANWITQGTYLYVYLDVYDGSYSRKLVTVYNDFSQVVADPSFPCAVTPSWNAAASTYSISVPTSCLGNFFRVDVDVIFDYETPTTYSQDEAGWAYFHQPAPSGYWMATAAGKVFSFGAVSSYGDVDNLMPWAKVVDVEPAPGGRGYWILDNLGGVTARGQAEWYGDAYVKASEGEYATAISATPRGDGYWIFTSTGRVLTFGLAEHYGDMSGTRLNGPVLDAIPTPSGLGYYMVGSDGGIFSFGDAKFYGSMGDKRLNAPVMSLVPDPDGRGYWLVASDGGVFAFEASFRGSMGGVRLNRPVTGMVPFGNGYLMVGEDGGIFNFSNLPFFGSLGATPPASPVVAVGAPI